MKAILKRLLRAVWRSVAPIRQPFVNKAHNHLRAVIAPLIDERVRVPLEANRWAIAHMIERNEQSFGRNEAFFEKSTRADHETDLVLNSLVREVVRLQMQIEHLEQLVPSPGSDTPPGLGLLERDGPCKALARASVRSERVMAG